MATTTRLAVCLLAILPAAAANLPAQQPLGALFGTLSSTASRGGILTTSGTLVARFEHDDYVGWGCTTSTPNRRAIRGVTFLSEDKNGSTQETYSVMVFGEDPALPGFPATAAPLLVLGPFLNPMHLLGPAQFVTTHVFQNPLEVPADRDVFVGIALAAAPLWPADGLAVKCLLGAPSQWPTYDAPGPAPIQHNGYGLAIDATGTRYYNSSRQLLIDLLCDAPGGACTARSVQTSFPIGAVAPGGGGFLSALHPDGAAPPLNTGRADDPGYVFLDNSLPNGSPVFFLADIGSFGPEVDLALHVPGSVGAFCLKPTTVMTLGFGLLTNGQAAHGIQFAAGARSAIAGLPLLQQGIALTPANTLHGSPCGRQVF